MRALLHVAFLAAVSMSVFSCSGSGSSSPGVSIRSQDPSEFSSSPGDCKEFIAAMPADYFHAWVDVPENPFDAASPLIHVFYYGPKTLNDNVVIFYNGGPGSDSHGALKSFKNEVSNRNLQSKISFIFMDQRGTGCSSAYPSQKTMADILRARWYGSTGIVYDSEAVRTQLLGARKWKAFGQSYGAFVVHRYVSLFPDSLVAGYAHANTINADPMERLYGRIYSQYRVLNMYFATYPQDKEKLSAIKNYLTATKCFQTVHIGQVCGHEMIESLVTYLGFSNNWTRLHSMITSVATTQPNGTSTVSDQQLRSLIDDMDYAEPEVGYSISVIAKYDRNVASTYYDNCSKIYARLQAQGIGEDQLLMNECMSGMQFKHNSSVAQKINEALQFQNNFLTMDDFKKGLNILNPKNFYLYSGEKDTFVPKDNFAEELAAVGSMINYTHFMNSGHEGYRTEQQVWDDLIK